MTSVRVAIVLPCYNDGVFLTDALRSLAGEEECEIVVIDDGSTDPYTLEVLDTVAATGVRVVHQANTGLSGARMRGVAETQAAFIHTLDSDDMLAPGAVASLADALEANPSAAVAWGDYRTFGVLERHFPMAPVLDPWRITYVDEIPSNSMVRRTALQAVGGWELKRGCEDWDLWMKFAEKGMPGVHVPAVTLYYRVHETQRMYTEAIKRHDERRACLRSRHEALYESRRWHRRRSAAPRALKLLFPAIDALPRSSEIRKGQLYAAVRQIFQPAMSPEGFHGIHDMLLRLARGAVRRCWPAARRS